MVALLAKNPLQAGVEQPAQIAEARQDVDPFAKGAKEFQNVTGAYFFFETFRNKFYVDATLTWKNALNSHMDLHLSAQNLINNRSSVGGQWLRGSYSPRGTTFAVSAEMRF